ncbi:unnamed protein product (macronuclear) [Paramecium tetraurelia]|uniref:Uncharacterized protein n=1 Tax=Paramecium tetraurelia TaxID=5888 RepID=A0C5F9_PARTE|nr:uncharacterized protein GSPATT00006525001 [Paramecium tetraurelia]CAK66026.1 unnamed protein product [Paramecium tetraurelia]|eukprot:XP_001433423.1 hypothetical protein (macronuclear) [Paramecium tetraurelia strain d4-2]
MQQQKEYIPIVLIEDKIKQQKFETEFTEEKLPLIESVIQTNKISTQIINSRTSPIKNIIPNGLKPIVFPNILQKTKDDMIKLRKHQLAQLNFENDQPPITMNIKTTRPRKTERDKSTQKMYTQASKNSCNKPIITELTTLARDNYSASPRSDSFKFRSLSPDIESQLWQVNNKINRINKAYEIKKEIHHLERFKTQWKIDVVQQTLQQKIVQVGLNTKKGLRSIFILIYLPHSNIHLRSSQTEAKQITNEVELSVFPYFTPVYEKIINEKEISENYKEWFSYFLDILHYKSYIPKARTFTLDGIEISALNQIPTYEKFLYIQLQGQFDFWSIMKQQLSLSGEFQVDKYPKLAIKLLDLRNKEEVRRFFSKRENLLPFYFRQLQVGSQTSIPSQYYIEIENNIREPDEEMFEQSIIQMNEKEQDTYLKVLQQYIHSNKSKYSNKLKNLEENMRQRLKKIKAMRRQSIHIKLKTKKFIRPEEEEHFERKLLYEDEKSIEEIKEDAYDHIFPQNTHIFKKKSKQITSVDDPFESLRAKDNQKFREILQLINVEKIVLEKNLSRQDVYHYLSLFKALMDSDAPQKIKDVNYPTLFISLDQLRRGVPFIALYKNKVNTKKLAEVYSRKYNYCEFMEFLDIFTTDYKVTEEELQEVEQEIIYSQSKSQTASFVQQNKQL